MKLPYNAEDPHSIIQYAKRFVGKSIVSEFGVEVIKTLNLNHRDKGQLGKVIEKLYFHYEPNSDARSDFEKAGLELKSSGLKRLKTKEYRAKERLVLSIINYFEVVEQNFNDDFLQGKNGHLLLIFYLYTKNRSQLFSKIILVGDWKYPEADIEVIKKDWLFIQQKIKNGKAHELSEGDTFYLGACTKGANSKTVREQPYNKVKAKQRAFSLKPKYVNHIIASIAGENKQNFGKLIGNLEIAKAKSIEDIVLEKFEPYYNDDIHTIQKKLRLNLNQKAKHFYSNLTKAILGIELDKEIEEFEKADIIVKTVRLKENDLPSEDMSFPNFDFVELIKESWEDSNFKNILEHKFLMVSYQYENDKLYLKKVKFWNMPYTDIKEAKKVWVKTRQVIKSGEIVRAIKNGVRFTNFPNKKFNSVSHVRPHARNKHDTLPLPYKDKLTGLDAYMKYCFWLNNTYIKDQIYLKD